MYELEPQVILTAVSMFFGFLFTAIAAMWMIWKAISELTTNSAKSFVEIRGDLKTVNTRMDGLDKRMDDLDSHMSNRMDDLGGQVRDLRGEVHGINEFLRRDSVKNTEDDKKS